MTIDKKKFLEFNLNTILVLAQMIGFFGYVGYTYANQNRDIEELQKWRSAYEAETKAFRAKVEEGTQSQRLDIAQYQRKTDNVEYRLTVLETATASQAEEQQKMTERLGEISGDLKVVKELLVRMDAASKRATR